MPDIFKKPPAPKRSVSKPSEILAKQHSPEEPIPKEEPEAPAPPPQPEKNSQNPVGIFTTFLKYPDGISFAGQDPDEKIALFLRRDFGTNTGWIISTGVLIIIPLLISFIFRVANISFPFFPHNFIKVFTVFYYFASLGFAFSNFLTWFFTIGLVTTKKAIDIDFVDISSIKFASADLSDIIDAKYTQNGFGQSFFDYGDVELVVQTPKEKLAFEKVPRPADVSSTIDDLTGKERNA